MQVHPTRASVDLAIVGVGVVACGILSGQAAPVAWGGALLLGLAIARGVTHLSVSRIRAAGFEMLWRGEARTRQVVRGQTFEIEAEIRNRDTRAARYIGLRVVASPCLRAELMPAGGEVPAGGRLKVVLRVSAERVGRHGIHGLSLEVEGSPGLFEVPLTFSNPFGVEVLPRPLGHLLRSSLGGRSQRHATAGRFAPTRGQGSDLRELREHHFGDPFKHIAWKASAKRGALVVREFEREERDIVWLLLDASVELWSGKIGDAPLDHAIDQVARVAESHLKRGNSVGLGIFARRQLAWLPPKNSAAQRTAIISALTLDTGCLDADRCDLDEQDLAVRIIEHMLPLDPDAASRIRVSDLERVARRAERVRGRAPFPPGSPFSNQRRERVLRRYFSAFGLMAPPRLEPDRPHTDRVLAAALTNIQRIKPKASLIYVWSPLKDLGVREPLLEAFKQRNKRITLTWIPIAESHGIGGSGGELAREVGDAVRLRVSVAEARGAQALKGAGIRLQAMREERPAPELEQHPEALTPSVSESASSVGGGL